MKDIAMKKILYPVLAVSVWVSLPAMAQSPQEVIQVKAKHEADRDKNTFEELLKENGGDHSREHWASQAIDQLINKYCGIMVGYPNNTFRGANNMTRYEMAAALYKLMQCLEVEVSKVQVPELDTSQLALKEDLQTAAALQAELRAELAQLKERHQQLSERVDALERVEIHGSLEVRHRERIGVTDGTDKGSPMFAPNNSNPTQQVTQGGNVVPRNPNDPNPLAFSNNIGQYSRDQYGVPNRYHSPSEPNLTVDDLAPFRIRNTWEVKAQLHDRLRLFTAFDIFDVGNPSSGLSALVGDKLVIGNGGHDSNEGLPNGNTFVFRVAALEYQIPEGNHRFHLGLMNFRSILRTGSHFDSLFAGGNWNGHSYGLVGWGGADIAPSNTAATNYRNRLSRYWAGGLDASFVDPDSLAYNNVTSPAASYDVDWGWGSFMVGLNYGSALTDLLQAANGNLASGSPAVMGNSGNFSTSGLYSGAVLQGLDVRSLDGSANGRRLVGNHLALPSRFGDGYGVAGVEGRFWQDSFPVRVQLAAMSYLNDALFDFLGPTRKQISGTLDLGWNKNFGATVQVNKSFMGFDRHSAGLFFNDIADSGWDIQVGANLATRGLFNVMDAATSSAGVAIGVPLYRPAGTSGESVKLILGVRQSFGDRWGNVPDAEGTPNQLIKDSGLTASLPWKRVAGLPVDLSAQYSLLLADGVWQLRPVAHDLSIISTIYW
jgi:hypothetical protein